MATLPNEIRLLPSVFDRLIDEDPGQATELPASRTQVLVQLKKSVGRDLQNLLNTRCRATSWPSGLDQLCTSIVAYGIPDCVGLSTGSLEQQESLRITIEQAISTFEPRLFKLVVSAAKTDDSSDRTLRFRIDAMLKVNPAPEPVAYDSRLDFTSGDFSVSGVRR